MISFQFDSKDIDALENNSHFVSRISMLLKQKKKFMWLIGNALDRLVFNISVASYFGINKVRVSVFL